MGGYGKEIAPEDMEGIFSYGVSDFATSESRGLGLFTARNYALAMQGTIRAENRGDGIAFLVTLPTEAGEIRNLSVRLGVGYRPSGRWKAVVERNVG